MEDDNTLREQLDTALDLLKDIAKTYRNAGEGKFSEAKKMGSLIQAAETMTGDRP